MLKNLLNLSIWWLGNENLRNYPANCWTLFYLNLMQHFGAKCDTQKERRIWWNLIKIWSLGLKIGRKIWWNLVLRKWQNGNVHIANNQLMRILQSQWNLPFSQWWNWSERQATNNYLLWKSFSWGKAVAKSSITMTTMAGSTTTGEAIPLHFQFLTMAKNKETMRLQTDIQFFISCIWGTFEGSDEKDWPITFDMNAKGGMDDHEFEKYVTNLLVPLFPDSEDAPGKRVIIKLDSGPGCLNKELHASHWMLFFHLYYNLVTQKQTKIMDISKVHFGGTWNFEFLHLLGSTAIWHTASNHIWLEF